jgi:hypothetical protein
LVDDATGGPAAEQSPMDCVDVRDRLTEYALSLLPAPEVDPVEEHLAWCAGCRKEAAELAGGAAVAAMSLAQTDPPAKLEERIVGEIRTASGAQQERRGRAKSRTIVLLAATLAIFMGLGWLVSNGRLQTALDARNASRDKARSAVGSFENLARELLGDDEQPSQGDTLREVQMIPELGHVGGGKALVFLSPKRPDWVLVYVGGIKAKGLVGVTVQSPDGEVLSLGQGKLDTGGGITLFRQDERSLRGFTRIVVTDRRGHVIMTGTVAGVAARPTTVA